MKKFLILLLPMIAIIAVGAFAEGQSEAGSTERPQVEITKAYYFGEPTDNSDIKAEWMEYMSDRFDIDLKVNAFPRPEYMQKYALAMSSGEIKGLGWIFGGSYMEDYYYDGATLNLNDYVKNNAVWKTLPEGMREANVRNGELLALPSQWSGLLGFARAIRTDWLENLGLDMPTTIDEFYDVMKAFTEDDPDGNGKDDTVGMTAAGVWNIQDIFMSFGVPTNHVGDHAITPDPNDGLRYNDGMLKPGMKAALEWLKKVYDEGYLDQEVFSNGGSQMRERMSSAMYGSTYYWATWGLSSFEARAKKVVPTATFDIILGLTSDYAKTGVNLGGVMGSGAPYVVIAGTKNPQEQVDAFLNIFLGDEVGYFSGRFGVYEKYFKFGPNNELIRIIKEEVDGKRKYWPGPGIIGDTEKYNMTIYPHVLQGEAPEASKARADLAVRNMTLKDQGLASGILYSQPGLWSEPNSETYRSIAADIKRIFQEAVAKAVTGQVSVDEAIADYIKQAGALGAQKILDEGNAANGKTSSTTWRY